MCLQGILGEYDAIASAVIKAREEDDKCGTGTHAAGVIISYAPLDTIIPVQPSKEGIVQTGYPPHETTEVLSLLKMDCKSHQDNLIILHYLI